MFEIKTPRLSLRPWQARDIDSLCQLANNAKVSRFLRDAFPFPYLRQDAELWVQASIDPSPGKDLAVDFQGQLIGGLGIHPFADVYRHSAEIGYWLGEPFWSQGFGTEAVGGLVRWAFESLPLIRIQAGVFEGNQASMRVLEKAGFMLEAVLKKHVVKEGKLLNEYLWVRFRP